jgi:hypothetical protein
MMYYLVEVQAEKVRKHIFARKNNAALASGFQ